MEQNLFEHFFEVLTALTRAHISACLLLQSSLKGLTWIQREDIK